MRDQRDHFSVSPTCAAGLRASAIILCSPMWTGLTLSEARRVWSYEPSGVLRISETCSCTTVSPGSKVNISSEGLAVTGAHSATWGSTWEDSGAGRGEAGSREENLFVSWLLCPPSWQAAIQSPLLPINSCSPPYWWLERSAGTAYSVSSGIGTLIKDTGQVVWWLNLCSLHNTWMLSHSHLRMGSQ